MDWNANVDLSQQQIESKIAQNRNNLPAETQITVEKMNPSILPVIGYTLESHGRSPIELSNWQFIRSSHFSPRVAGVSEVRVIGGKTKEYWLELDPRENERINDHTGSLINTAISQTNFIRTNGYLSDYRYLYLTTTDASVHSTEDIRRSFFATMESE